MNTALVCVLLALTIACPAAAGRVVGTFKNTLDIAADPWVVKNPNGKGYFYCYSDCDITVDAKHVYVDYADAPYMFTHRKTNPVFDAVPGSMYSSELWAPELHWIDGHWYIYVAADNGEQATHRMFVLKGTSKDPTKPFVMINKMVDTADRWSIDGTVFKHKGKLYAAWSFSDNGQVIKLAETENPTTIKGEGVIISRPEYDWECRELKINEGPAVLTHGKKLYIVYSASFANSDFYCLGLLEYTGGDILDPKNWKKHEKPVFEGGNGIISPGHCSFTKDAEGKDWIVYHCILNKGDDWTKRRMRMQPVKWDGDFPVFGEPVPDGVELEFPYIK